MLEIVTLVFQGVEGFVLDFPASPATSHDLVSVAAGNLEVGNPSEVPGITAIGFPVFKEIDPDILIGLVDRQVVGEPKEMTNTRISFVPGVMLDGFAFFNGFREAFEEIGVIPFFGAEDKMAPMGFEIPDMWRIGAKAILGDDGLEVGMVFSEFV